MLDKVALGQVFPLSVSFNRCSITWKNKKLITFIFITVLQNKLQSCGASVASAAGPFTTKKILLLFLDCLIPKMKALPYLETSVISQISARDRSVTTYLLVTDVSPLVRS
jgi:hypothetical protein